MFDTCNCENSEDCLCAALSSYVRACAAKGIQLHGWRTDVCCKYSLSHFLRTHINKNCWSEIILYCFLGKYSKC